jgi:hypothetical protein
MHQAAVLVLFNERDELTYREIQDSSKLPDELRRPQRSMALGKVRLPSLCHAILSFALRHWREIDHWHWTSMR